MSGLTLALFLAFASFAHAVTLEEFLAKRGYSAVPMQINRSNHYVINGKVNGRKVSVMVDTGCPALAIESIVAAGLKRAPGPQRRLMGVHGEFSAPGQAVLIDKLELGPVAFREEPAELLKTQATTTYAGSKIPTTIRGGDRDLLIGWEFLTRHHAIIDTAALKLFVREDEPPAGTADQFGRALLAGGFKLIPLTARDMSIEVSAAVNAHPVLLILDTGSPVTALDVNRAADLGLDAREKLGESVDISGKRSPLSSARADVIRIGDFKIEKMAVGLFDLDRYNAWRAQAEEPVVHGFLGPEVLGRGRGVIDCASLRLYLHPGK